MQKIRNFTKSILVPTLLISPFMYIVSAQQQAPATTPPVYNAQGQQDVVPNENASLKKEEAQERRCDMVTAKIDENIERYRMTEERHHGVYDGLGTKLQNLLNRLNEEGYTGPNIEALEEDVAELETLALKLKNSYSLLNTNLVRARNIACGETPLAYKQALKESRTSLTETKNAIMEIREFYLTNVKTDIEAIRQQIREQKMGQQDNVTEEVETEEPQE